MSSGFSASAESAEKTLESLGNVSTAKIMWARARDQLLENASSRFYRAVADVHNHAHRLRCRLTRFSRHAIGVPLYTVSIYNRQAVRG